VTIAYFGKGDVLIHLLALGTISRWGACTVPDIAGDLLGQTFISALMAQLLHLKMNQAVFVALSMYILIESMTHFTADQGKYDFATISLFKRV